KSFVARQGEADEIGKALAMNGMAAGFGFIFATLVFSNIFNATVSVFAGFFFVFGALVVGGCFCGVVWVDVDILKRNKRVEDEIHQNAFANAGAIFSTDKDSKCFT